ncbi:hypothetical protein E1B28_006533 [Marasmius oreades]|uniref:HNH nuclease domain-containing protein n=1 Tax=Marasmius oreades TaxID=181124 RepID=A0A9P7UVN4_9AGAR|nr:uncharacterized protein E1B28_006533 [Marasmius oreades]KAG7095838.1 hypothetical protein E1B28_006533 [Marasmius oreades]
MNILDKYRTVSATPLPTVLLYFDTADDILNTNSQRAYDACFKLEREVTSEEQVKYARVLGYLILHPPSSYALTEIVKEINSCKGEQDTLLKLGRFFVDSYIRGFKKYKKKTSDLSKHPSRPSFDEDKEALMAVMEEAPTDSSLAKKQALIRDGYRCVVTGKYNQIIPATFDVNEEEVMRVGTGWTECAHIVPDSTYTYTKISDEECLTSIAKRGTSASLLSLEAFRLRRREYQWQQSTFVA